MCDPDRMAEQELERGGSVTVVWWIIGIALAVVVIRGRLALSKREDENGWPPIIPDAGNMRW